jgi:hypothetical protein
VTLYDVARQYDDEAHRALRLSTRWQLRATAELFRRMISNRDAADPSRMTIHYRTHVDVTQRWCSEHGYRAVAGIGGLTLQRDNEPALVARPEDTLHWDGERISVTSA